jgi:hypothetical protein
MTINTALTCLLFTTHWMEVRAKNNGSLFFSPYVGSDVIWTCVGMYLVAIY